MTEAPDAQPGAAGRRIVRPPLRAEAELCHGPLDRGRCGAVLITARTADEVPVECVVKLDKRLTMPPAEHLREWVAAEVGRHLGVDVPASYEVVITRAFAQSIDDLNIRSVALASLGSAYGSHVVTGVGPATIEALPSVDVRMEMAELIAFDVLIHNADRRIKNPNVLVSRRRVVAIDHGDAFAFLLPVIGAPDPAEDALLDMLPQHIFASTLRGARNISFDRFRDRLAALDDAFFDDLAAATPAAWTKGMAAGNLELLTNVLRHRRDAAGRWLPQVESWMHK